MKLEPDVILYNAGNTAHAEILQESGIPCIGFATVGHETEADPLNRYKQWLDLLEDVFGEEGKTDAFTAAGGEIVADVEARIAAVPEDERPSALILWKYSDGVPQVSGNGTFGTYWMKHLGVTDVAAEAADIVLTRSDIASVVTALRLSRATLRTIKSNLFWAFAYNTVAIPVAVAGLLNPMIAGAAMAFSSVFVVLNSMRLTAFRK